MVNVVTDAGRQAAGRCGDPGVEGRKAVVVEQAEQVKNLREAGAEDLVGVLGGGKVAAADTLAAGLAGQHGDQATIGAPAHLDGPAVGLAVQAGLAAGVDQPRTGQVGVLAAEPRVITRRGREQHQGRRRRRRALREVRCLDLVRCARARAGGPTAAGHAGKEQLVAGNRTLIKEPADVLMAAW